MKPTTFDDWFVKFVINPRSRYMVIWNVIITVVVLISIFLDTLILGFHLRPLL